MLIASLAILVGLALLVWSADRFVEGAAASDWDGGGWLRNLRAGNGSLSAGCCLPGN